VTDGSACGRRQRTRVSRSRPNRGQLVEVPRLLRPERLSVRRNPSDVRPGSPPRTWCSEPSRLGPVGRCLWSGGHRVILLEQASSARSHHDGHHLLLWTSSPWCQSTWPRLTRISCARCSAPSSRRSWVPRSMRSAALPTTLRAPSAPIGATGSAAVLRATRLGTTRAQRSQSFVRGAIPDWIQERRRRSCGSPHQLLATCSRARGARGDASRSSLGPLGSRSARRPRSRTMAHSLDAEVQAFRTRPPDSGPYPIVLGGCARGQGTRGWWDRERPRARRHWGACAEGHLRDPRHLGRHQRGCGRLARLLALARGMWA